MDPSALRLRYASLLHKSVDKLGKGAQSLAERLCYLHDRSSKVIGERKLFLPVGAWGEHRHKIPDEISLGQRPFVFLRKFVWIGVGQRHKFV